MGFGDVDEKLLTHIVSKLWCNLSHICSFKGKLKEIWQADFVALEKQKKKRWRE